MPASGVPGLAYAVVDDGGITTAGARGVVRLGGEVAVTPDTPFVIGSISKSFTALSVMQLVEAGEIDLDTEVSHYLDVFSGRPAGAITIGQLLSHTSGFSTGQGNAAHPDPTGEGDELARGVAQLAAVTPAGAPGTQWEYSNANYEILGRVVEVVSGQEFQAYVAQHILEPVGMGHSFVADGEVHERHGDRAHAVVRHQAAAARHHDRPGNGPAGRGRGQRQRPGALPADDDERRGRRAERRRARR